MSCALARRAVLPVVPLYIIALQDSRRFFARRRDRVCVVGIHIVIMRECDENAMTAAAIGSHNTTTIAV